MEPDRLSRELTDKLEAARMTAEALSLKAGLARDTVGRWIRGATVPTPASLRLAERALGSRLGCAVDLSAAIGERRSAQQRGRQQSAGFKRGQIGSVAILPGEQVDSVLAREKAPEHLSGRDAELGRLAAFCDGTEVYAWWRGPPWAGKTALIAHFALHPPANIHVASFLADSRIPGGASGTAFLTAMIRQLTHIADAPVMATGWSAVELRDQFLGLLELAGSVLRPRGEGLVLLVDGLDEDQGDPPSILDCLPRRPPDCVKVIVSSRPGLEIPSDHPLVQPSCPRLELVPSPAAQDVRELADHELRAHLNSAGRRRLLGFIIASGGGLSVRDLAELADKPIYKVDVQLRPFRRILGFATRDGERVCQMAHDELEKAAARWLSEDLVLYRERIYEWYRHYQASCWRQEISGYLLWRYWHHLRASADLEWLALITADSIRHDRMLKLGGSDAPALREVSSALRALADQPDPDLSTQAVLTLERERLASRNHAMPWNLPAVWARLGQTRRAQELARSIPEILDRAEALSILADAMAHADPALASLALQDAEAAVGSATGRDFRRAEKARELIQRTSLVVTRRRDLIWGYPEPKWQWPDQMSASSWFAGSDAVRLQHRLATLARAMDTIRRDDIDGFGAIMNDADRARVLIARAEVLASVGSGQAARLASAAEQAIRSVGQPGQPVDMLLGGPVSATGTVLDHVPQPASELRDHAAEVTRTLTMPLLRAVTLAAQAATQASVEPARASDLAEEAGETARYADEPDGYKAVALAGMSVLLAGALPHQARTLAQQAEEQASAVREDEVRAITQASVAAVLADAYEDESRDLARNARQCADAIVDREPDRLPVPVIQPVIRASVAAVLARTEPNLAGELADDAARSAKAIARPSTRAQVLAEVADALCQVQVFQQQAQVLARDAENAARSVLECGFRLPVLARMAWALRLASTGATRDQAVGQDWYSTNSGHEGAALETLAAGLAQAGEWDAAECAARAAEIALHPFPGAALSKVAAPMAAAGYCDRAEALAQSVGMFRPRVLAAIACAQASSDPDSAKEKARAAVQAARQYGNLPWNKPNVFLDTAVTLAAAFPEQALSLADDLYQDITADEDDSGFGQYTGEHLARIAKVKALAGRWDQAQDIARGIDSLNDRANAFADIAIAAIAANKIYYFVDVYNTVPPEFLGLWARLTVTQATIAGVTPELGADWVAKAELYAQHTQNPARSLITTAEALYDALTSQEASPGHPLRQRAQRMLALALAEEGIEWISAMPVLGKLAPGAVRAFYDKLITLGTSPV